MKVDRRQFLKTTMAASAAAAFPGVWLRARQASALQPCETGVNLIIVQLKGGNDGVNTVIPLTDGSGANRSTYDTIRPLLAIDQSNMDGTVGGQPSTQVGNDALHNGQLALHPHMQGLKHLYDTGNLAVLLGVHYPKANDPLSHDVSEKVWYRADPALSGTGTGWMGRTLDTLCTGNSNPVPAVDIVENGLTPLYYGNTSIITFDKLSNLNFPVSDNFNTGQAAAYKSAFNAIYSDAAANGTNYVTTIGGAGSAAVSHIDDYKTATAGQALAVNLTDVINGTTLGSGGFGFSGVPNRFNLATRLRTVFALMNGKQPGNVPLGCRIFRVETGGFDTHSDQGSHIPLATKSLLQKVQTRFPGELHGQLLHQVDRAISAFWQDCVDKGFDKNTVIMTFSEFGRRAAENTNTNGGSAAHGTDHGLASPHFVIGPKAGQSTGPAHLVGGMYGAYPELDSLDNNGNLVFQLDFRNMYAEIMSKWLAVSGANTSTILNGWGATPQGFFV